MKSFIGFKKSQLHIRTSQISVFLNVALMLMKNQMTNNYSTFNIIVY